MTWLQFARYVALSCGRVIPDRDAETILWEQTSFPFDGRNEVEGQIREFFTGWPGSKARDDAPGRQILTTRPL